MMKQIKTAPPLTLTTHVQYLKGVGPVLGEVLKKNGVKTVQDLIEIFPRTYEDRRSSLTLAQIKVGQLVSLRLQIVKVQSIPLGRTHRKIYDIVLKDSSGIIHCKFFRVPYKGYFERFKPWQEVRLVGKPILYRGRIEFHHPDLRDIEPDEEIKDEIIPIYVETDGISSFKWQKLIQKAFSELEKNPEIKVFDPLPIQVVNKFSYPNYWQALKDVHQPQLESFEKYLDVKSLAHQRFIFEELFFLEAFMYSKKIGLQKEKSLPIEHSNNCESSIIESLPFRLTKGQMNAIADIKSDFKKPYPMHRLVQGDVGCGKTMVAFLSVAIMSKNFYQSCLMVPTEILAEQHFANAQKFLNPAGIRVAILTGRTKTQDRKDILESLMAGKIDLLIGTHAVIEPDVQFKSLNLVIIDEQHRFGVQQRALLKKKGQCPHFLIMTATPIPRTLSMTVFGDLDVTLIKELPPGRSPIQTRAIFQNKREQALDFLLQQIKKGRQAYIVYPLVEESEKIDLKNATEEFEKLKAQFSGIKFCLLHGKMKSIEKDQIMTDFKDRKYDALVSTTVIEVGVDVPNANIMIVEHAERFGLSQLHQLRGRVGRGEHKSFCVLIMGYAVSSESKDRISFMETTTDGFEIAEYDLKIRGPGEFLGTKQSGLINFKLASLIRDQDILVQARNCVADIFQNDPDLKKPDHSFLKSKIESKKGSDLG